MMRNKGVQYMLIASFVFSLMNVCVKMISHIPVVQIILCRSVVSLIISYAFLKRQKVNILGNNKKMLLLRGFSGAIALMLLFYLLQQIPLAAASTLHYLAPIFTTLLAFFWLKEKIYPIQIIFFIISFLGVVLIQGFDDRISYLHVIIGVSASVFMGIAYNCVSLLKNTEHPLVIIIYFPYVVFPISLIASFFVWKNPQAMDWIYLLAVGVLTQIAQYCMTKAYQHEQVNRVSIVTYVSIIFVIGFGYLFFDETYNWVTLSGMLLVVFGVILNLLLKSFYIRKPN